MTKFEINEERMENGLPPVEGWEEWAKHQTSVSEEHSKEVDKALGIVRDENGKVIK